MESHLRRGRRRNGISLEKREKKKWNLWGIFSGESPLTGSG
jgi:hypothetical protein